MTRDAGLALAEDVDQLADRQFAPGQQGEDAKPRRLRRRPERRQQHVHLAIFRNFRPQILRFHTFIPFAAAFNKS